MRKIKVLHIHTLPIISGSGINTLLTMKGLDGNKYEVEFACAPGGSLIDKVKREGIRFQSIKHFRQKINLFNDCLALWELVRLMSQKKYDIVHTHNSKAGFIGRLAARIARVPIIVHTIHGFAFHEYERPPRRILFILLERFAARFSDRLITVSEPLKEWGLRLNIGKPNKYVTIYDGIEVEKFKINININEKKKELRIKQEEKVVGVVAKLWEGKGHKTILEAAPRIIKEIPEVKFLFVGEGYLRSRLEARIQELGLSERIIFTGFREDIPEVTAIFDIAVLDSFFEGLGRVLLEAMVLGKPVIATKVGGIVDVVKDGETGILIPPRDANALAKAIITLLKDKKLAQRMGEAGKRRIDERFIAQTMVKKITALYDELINEKLKRKNDSLEKMLMQCIFSIDVEEWFHILDIESTPQISQWALLPSRVEKNFLKLLDLFEENNSRVTCFFLAWIAEKYPHLVKEAKKRGHEIASHGYSHQLVYKMTQDAFLEDALKSKKIIEDIIGNPVLGYRAPGFSVTENTSWFFEALMEAGYIYDSSVFPAPRGQGGIKTNVYAPYIVSGNSKKLIEFPITVVKLFGRPLCLFGGGYLRLSPYFLIRKMAIRVLNENRPVIFYLHPRDIDLTQPRLSMNITRRFKSYVNLNTTMAKAKNILKDFQIITYENYIQSKNYGKI